jgi:DNA replication protein DnaC
MIERRIKAAKFPATKSLDSFDFKAIPSLNKALTMELARCAFADRRENVIALGPSGTGKTHIALGLGLAACQKGLKVRFATAAARANVSQTIGVPLARSTNASRPLTIAGSSVFRRPSPARIS